MSGTPEKKANKGRFTKDNPGPGRTKGVPNKSTAIAREAIARFVDGNAQRLEGWLDQIAEQDGPKAAFQCFMDVVEYHVPKLARTEVTGAAGGPVQVQAQPDLSRLSDAELAAYHELARKAYGG